MRIQTEVSKIQRVVAFGNKLLYPHKSILNDFGNPNKNPLCIAYQSYMKMPYDRQTWDLTSVLDAIEPDKNWFLHSPKGTISIDNDGKTTFVESETGMHQYLIIPEEKVQKTLETLVNRVTGKNNKK